MVSLDWSPTLTLTPLETPWLDQAKVEVKVLRLDQLGLINGNKWFKLRLALQEAAAAGAEGLISLGGAHSNHLHALAAAGQQFGFKTVGLMRGHACRTPTVDDLQAMGMKLHWLGYAGYRARHEPGFWDLWRERYPGFYCINEGGFSLAGAQGCRLLVDQLAGGAGFDAWWLAVGTGTTLAGLVMALQGLVTVHGALAVPSHYGARENIQRLLTMASLPDQGYQLHEAAGEGFGRVDDQLLAFIHEVHAQTGLRLEPVYTAKALRALKEALEQGVFAPYTRLLFVHTGGLQGARTTLGPVVGQE